MTATYLESYGKRFARCRTSESVGRRYHHGASRFSQDGRRYFDGCTPARIGGRRFRIDVDLSAERAREWDSESLAELTSPLYARTVQEWAGRELARRDGYRGTGLSRAALLAMWRDDVDAQYLAAEMACHGQLLTPAARAAGVRARSLFTGPVRRAELYASEELKRFWLESPRLTFDAWLGDADALTAAAVGF